VADQHHEAPNTVVERILVILALVGAGWAAGHLAQAIRSNLDVSHTWEFIGLSLLIPAGLYLLWLLWALSTVSYSLTGDSLVLRQGWRRIRIPLDEEFALHRWRLRWGWSGTAEGDLGVETIRLMPPVWLARPSSVWVVLAGATAVGFRPSVALLATLKARQPERRAG